MLWCCYGTQGLITTSCWAANLLTADPPARPPPPPHPWWPPRAHQAHQAGGPYLEAYNRQCGCRRRLQHTVKENGEHLSSVTRQPAAPANVMAPHACGHRTAWRVIRPCKTLLACTALPAHVPGGCCCMLGRSINCAHSKAAGSLAFGYIMPWPWHRSAQVVKNLSSAYSAIRLAA